MKSALGLSTLLTRSSSNLPTHVAAHMRHQEGARPEGGTEKEVSQEECERRGTGRRERERGREQDALVEGAVEMTRVGGVVAVRAIRAVVIGPGKEIIHSRLALRPLC